MMHEFHVPQWVKKGDTVAITATARAIDASELKLFISHLEQWGLHVKLSNNIGLRYHQFAGTDIERAEAMQALLDDEDIRAIFCARGGYGTARMMPYLNWKNFMKHPKWIVGFSDITALHALLHSELKVASVHGMMPSVFKEESRQTLESMHSLRKALFGELLEYELNDHPYNRADSAEGILWGGNLSVLYSLRGSRWDCSWENKLVFIEDLDEYLYHIDRMMLNFTFRPEMDQCKGLLVGGMSDMNDNEIPFGMDAESIIAANTASNSFLRRFALPSGHEPINKALRLGMNTQIAGNKLILAP